MGIALRSCRTPRPARACRRARGWVVRGCARPCRGAGRTSRPELSRAYVMGVCLGKGSTPVDLLVTKRARARPPRATDVSASPVQGWVRTVPLSATRGALDRYRETDCAGLEKSNPPWREGSAQGRHHPSPWGWGGAPGGAAAPTCAPPLPTPSIFRMWPAVSSPAEHFYTTGMGAVIE